MEIIEKYPNKPWDWEIISENPNLTMEFIEKYPTWDWEIISENPNLTMEFIEKYPNKPWNWRFISRNPNITMKIIEKYIDKINFVSLSQNKFTFENMRIKKKEGYLLLEKERSFHKLMNLYVISQYL